MPLFSALTYCLNDLITGLSVFFTGIEVLEEKEKMCSGIQPVAPSLNLCFLLYYI